MIHKRVLYFITILLLTGCNQVDYQINKENNIIEKIEIPDNIQNISSLKYNNLTSEWFFDGYLYSGFIVDYYDNKKLKLKMSVYQGKRQNKTEKWYSNGKLMEVSSYHNGKLNGEKKVWVFTNEHILISQLNYKLGKAHGEQRKWYPSGEIYKIMNFDDGIESGIQKAFRKNGALYANYEARDGRIYGLKKSKLCYSLEDEEILIYTN
jgi:antitoxin component YwqK of YwqJK toxin-antitoxin module